MLVEALSALVLASAGPPAEPPGAAGASSRDDLLIAIRSRCPVMEPRIRAAGPQELLRLESGFREQLSSENRSRLDQAMHDPHCAAGGGAGCQASTGLAAILDSDMAGAFADYICKRGAEPAAPR